MPKIVDVAPRPDALNTFLLDAMQRSGIPNSMLTVYKDFVRFEWDMQSVKPYASFLDVTSPDLQVEWKAQNRRIYALRAAMKTTEKGREELEHIKAMKNELMKKGVYWKSAVPFPPFSAFQPK